MAYGEIAIKLGIAMIALWTMTKVLGKKEISQLTAFDFVSSLMLSELVGNTIYERSATIWQLLFALGLWTGMSYGLEKLTLRFPRLAKRVSGSPELIVRNGLVDEKALKRNNLEIEQLHALMREQQVFSIREIAYAIFETDGSLSILKKPGKSGESVSLPVIVVSKGQIDRDALRFLKKDTEWLMSRLREQGLDGTEKVVFAEWSEETGLYVQPRNHPDASFAVSVG